MIFEFLITQRAKKMGYPLMKVKDSVIEQYQSNVREGYGMEKFDIIRKLSRNWHIGNMTLIHNGIITKAYGNMDIYLDMETMTIIDIVNHKGKTRKQYINYMEKDLVNEIYCIRQEGN